MSLAGVRFFRRGGRIIPIRLSKGFTPAPILERTGIIRKALISSEAVNMGSRTYGYDSVARVFGHNLGVVSVGFSSKNAKRGFVSLATIQPQFRKLGLGTELYAEAFMEGAKNNLKFIHGSTHSKAVAAIRSKFTTRFFDSFGRMSNPMAKLSASSYNVLKSITRNPFYKKGL